MRAVTLHPHWAHAVAHLGKRCENRSRPIPPALIGERVAIHAGASAPQTDRLFSNPWGVRIHGCSVDRDGIARAGLFGKPLAPIATRAIVATAVLGWCRESVAVPRPPPWSDAHAAWWWRLDDVHTLAEAVPFPKPYRGQLGLWHLPEEIAEAVRQADA